MFELKKPCPACPFLRNSPTPLRPGRLERIVNGMVKHGESNFICHKTIDYDTQFSDEDETGERDFRFEYGKNQACAGAMIVLEKMGFATQMMRIGERFGDYDRDELMKHKDMVIEPEDLGT